MIPFSIISSSRLYTKHSFGHDPSSQDTVGIFDSGIIIHHALAPLASFQTSSKKHHHLHTDPHTWTVSRSLARRQHVEHPLSHMPDPHPMPHRPGWYAKSAKNAGSLVGEHGSSIPNMGNASCNAEHVGKKKVGPPIPKAGERQGHPNDLQRTERE